MNGKKITIDIKPFFFFNNIDYIIFPILIKGTNISVFKITL